MKLNKKLLGLIAGVVCVILLIILLLTMCSGGSQEVTNPSESTTEATQAPVLSTEAAAETTAPSMEEETEETTEATEETTEATTGGSSTPGGSGGGSIGGSSGTTTSDAPKAGSTDSPYVEVISQFPDTVDTVSVAAGGSVHYNLTLLDESVARYGQSLLVIEGENVSVIYNEKTYTAENGVVSVPLIQPQPESQPEAVAEDAAEEEEVEEEEFDDSITIQICNNSQEARILTLQLDAPLGTVDNPQELIRKGDNGALDFTAALEAQDEDGYCFGFTAERDGTLMLQLDAVEEAAYDVIVTAGDQKLTLSSDGESALEMDFQEGDQVVVCVLARADEDGARPAVEAKLTGYADYYGSKTNPIEVSKDFTTEELEPGQVLYYLVKDQKSMALNVEYPAYVIYNGKTYQEELPEVEAPAEGEEQTTTEVVTPVVSVKIGNGEEPALMAIGNGGEEAASFAVTFTKPIGHKENKKTVVIRDDEAEIDGVNTAEVEAGDQEIYWFTWTNDQDTGILTLKFQDLNGWKYHVIHTADSKTTTYENQTAATFDLVVNYEDLVEIQIAPMETDGVGSISFEASFLAHTLIAADGETFLTVEGGNLIYCKQGMKYADGAIMTVVAVEADEEGNAKLDEEGNVILVTDSDFTIDYEGVIYTSVDGKIIVTGIEMDSNNPDIFSFRNDEQTANMYRVSFSYPLGHQTNPYVITDGVYTVDLYGDGGSGTYYSWTTSTPCTFTFEIDPSSAWSYNISSTRDTTVSASTNNGVATDYVPYVELVIGQGHLNESKDGTVTVSINLGNPSSDAANKSTVTFRVDRYKTLVANDITAKLAAGENRRFMQMLTDASAAGMTITGGDSFKVVYAGKEYTSVNGKVEITNFATTRTYFDVINLSAAEQQLAIDVIYPVLVKGSMDVNVGADETCYLVQNLEDTSATGMEIIGSGDFQVVYNGVSYDAVDGAVKVTNFTTAAAEFKILNKSGEAKSYRIAYQYPLGSFQNPEELKTDEQVTIALKSFTTVDSTYCYVWTAEEDGTFQFDLVGNINTLRWRPWKYEITHGEDVYASQGSQFAAVITQSFAVSKGDKVIIKMGVVALDQSTQIPIQVTFTKAEPVALQEVLTDLPKEEELEPVTE